MFSILRFITDIGLCEDKEMTIDYIEYRR